MNNSSCVTTVVISEAPINTVTFLLLVPCTAVLVLTERYFVVYNYIIFTF